MSTLPSTRQSKPLAPRLTPRQFLEAIDAYWNGCMQNPLPDVRPSFAGVASHLRLTKREFERYQNGDIDSPLRDQYQRIVEMFLTDLEAMYETALMREKGSTAGAQFALASKFHWQTTVKIEVTEKPKLVISVPPELERLLAQDDSIIEGESKRVG